MPRKYVERVGEDGFKKAPVGAGPYRFVSQNPGVDLVMEAYEGSWRKVPSVKRLVFRSMPDETTRAAALRAGDVDIVYLLSGPTAEEVKRAPGLRLAAARPPGVVFLVARPEKARKFGPAGRQPSAAGRGNDQEAVRSEFPQATWRAVAGDDKTAPEKAIFEVTDIVADLQPPVEVHVVSYRGKVLGVADSRWPEGVVVTKHFLGDLPMNRVLDPGPSTTDTVEEAAAGGSTALPEVAPANDSLVKPCRVSWP